ncbi:MAG: 4Fe-4S binding protein [Armatimonadia bacterium]
MSDRVYPKDAGWKDMAAGGVIPQAGNAVEYKTGGWRTFRPVRNNEKCINCLQCWIYCPDDAIICEEQTIKGKPYDLDHCKGCGICANICPAKCIEMKVDTECEN